VFNDDITLTNADTTSQTMSAIIKNSRSTVRKDASQPLDEPQALTISHEVSKDKKRQNSAVILDRTVLDADEVTLGNLRVVVRVSFDTGQITEAMIQEAIAKQIEFLTTANVTKLVNGEH
jgi:hypothetical protein